MFDRWTSRLVKKPLDLVALRLKRLGCRPDQITFASFCIGIGVLPALYLEMYWLALVCILLNRLGDGLDGALARMTGASDAGGFLDIVLDFIFYSLVVLGFAVASPEVNSLAAAFLLFSFVGTGSSFLAFAIMAEKRGIENIVYPHKRIYYLTGLAEGTETFLFFILFCIFPTSFPLLASVFGFICLLTTLTRVIGGYLVLRTLG
ncbi:MAG: CDP-alcohol phosphatidyltransferase family protein [Desulforhopalus sp.]